MRWDAAQTVTSEECPRNQGSRGCSGVEAKQELLLMSIQYGFISPSSLPCTPAFVIPTHPPPLLSLGSDVSSPRCWSSQVPRLSKSPRGSLAESPRTQHIYPATSEKKSRCALRFVQCSVPWTQKRWVSIYVSKRQNKPGRENMNSSCLGIYSLPERMPRVAICFLSGDYISYSFDYLLL